MKTVTVAPTTASASAPGAPSTGHSLDRWFWLAILIASAVVVPRSILISLAHSETIDEPAHVRRGLTLSYGNPGDISIQMNDPLFGDVLLTVPMLLMGNSLDKPLVWEHMPPGRLKGDADVSESVAYRQRVARSEVLYGHAQRPETILLALATWKALLFVPFAGLVFYVGRSLYGLASGWVALAAVLVDPTFAAHTPIAALDVLGVESILLACWTGWWYLRGPTLGRLVVTAFTLALALSVKHTAIAVPPILACYGVAFWIRNRSAPLPAAPVSRTLAVFVGTFCVSMWALTLFDYSTPRQWMWPLSYPKGGGFSFMRDVVDPLLDLRWPAGIYIGSFIGGTKHSSLGHWSYLLGRNNPAGGWWYYFPVVAAYKVPFGVVGLMGLALASLKWLRPRFDELFLFIPAALYTAMMMSTPINIGFRHFLPPLVFIYLLASRFVGRRGIADCRLPIADSQLEGGSRAGNDETSARVVGGAADAQPGSAIGNPKSTIPLASLCLLAALAQTLPFHPDYIAYVNFRRDDAWRDIADSNIDWGQSLKQVRRWLDEHPTTRPVYLGNFFDERNPGIGYYLGDRVKPIRRIEGVPPEGLLIISPNWVVSVFDYNDSFRSLRSERPIDRIGHNMLVYDLDAMRARREGGVGATSRATTAGSP